MNKTFQDLKKVFDEAYPELQDLLDDRFTHQKEFWDTLGEHTVLEEDYNHSYDSMGYPNGHGSIVIEFKEYNCIVKFSAPNDSYGGMNWYESDIKQVTPVTKTTTTYE